MTSTLNGSRCQAHHNCPNLPPYLRNKLIFKPQRERELEFFSIFPLKLSFFNCLRSRRSFSGRLLLADAIISFGGVTFTRHSSSPVDRQSHHSSSLLFFFLITIAYYSTSTRDTIVPRERRLCMCAYKLGEKQADTAGDECAAPNVNGG